MCFAGACISHDQCIALRPFPEYKRQFFELRRPSDERLEPVGCCKGSQIPAKALEVRSTRAGPLRRFHARHGSGLKLLYGATKQLRIDANRYTTADWQRHGL